MIKIKNTNKTKAFDFLTQIKLSNCYVVDEGICFELVLCNDYIIYELDSNSDFNEILGTPGKLQY